MTADERWHAIRVWEAYASEEFLIPELVFYYENSSFIWALSGVMKPSPSMDFRCQAGSRFFPADI
jgi:hypothetical protein